MDKQALKLTRDFSAAFSAIGQKIMPLDKACRLLALVYVCGGDNTAFTHDPYLISDVIFAQSVCNVGDGLTPKREAAELIQKNVLELRADEIKYSLNEPMADWAPDWAIEVAKEYGIKINRQIGG